MAEPGWRMAVQVLVTRKQRGKEGSGKKLYPSQTHPHDAPLPTRLSPNSKPDIRL